METILDYLDTLLYGIYYQGVEPLLIGIAWLLKLFFSPLEGFSPVIQILGIAFVAAFSAIVLSKRFSSRNEKSLRASFQKRLAGLSTTTLIGDRQTEKLVRNGISQQADKIYEQLLLDKFIELGITYFFPLFFFLIWIEYDIFSPENLTSLTGISFAWVTPSGTQISAAYLYLWFFNGILFSWFLIRTGLRFVFNRGIFKVKNVAKEPVTG